MACLWLLSWKVTVRRDSWCVTTWQVRHIVRMHGSTIKLKRMWHGTRASKYTSLVLPTSVSIGSESFGKCQYPGQVQIFKIIYISEKYRTVNLWNGLIKYRAPHSICQPHYVAVMCIWLYSKWKLFETKISWDFLRLHTANKSGKYLVQANPYDVYRGKKPESCTYVSERFSWNITSP